MRSHVVMNLKVDVIPVQRLSFVSAARRFSSCSWVASSTWHVQQSAFVISLIRSTNTLQYSCTCTIVRVLYTYESTKYFSIILYESKLLSIFESTEIDISGNTRTCTVRVQNCTRRLLSKVRKYVYVYVVLPEVLSYESTKVPRCTSVLRTTFILSTFTALHRYCSHVRKYLRRYESTSGSTSGSTVHVHVHVQPTAVSVRHLNTVQ